VDIGSTLKAIARYWWLALPVILLTALGVFYVIFMQPRLYESTSTYLMLNPEPGKAATANPFLQLPDQAAVVGVVSEIANSPRVNTELVAQGASKDYEVGPSETYGQGSRILEVYAPGTSPAQALLTADLVGERMRVELLRIQDEQDVDKNGRISLLALNPQPEARLKVSSLLRSVVAVVLLGAIVLFLFIGVAQAIEDARSRRRKALPATGSDTEPASGPSP
jgi:hypothetical protein